MNVPLAKPAQQSEAVCFLLHWPSPYLDAWVPDVIRHTALRSSDFPPPPDGKPREAAIIRPPALPSVYALCALPAGEWSHLIVSVSNRQNDDYA